MVEQDNRFALYLPSVASRYNLVAGRLRRGAAAQGRDHRAALSMDAIRMHCMACGSGRGAPARRQFRARSRRPTDLSELIARLLRSASAICCGISGPTARSSPATIRCRTALEGVELPRLAHAAWVLARAARCSIDRRRVPPARATVLLGTADETLDGIWLATPGQRAFGGGDRPAACSRCARLPAEARRDALGSAARRDAVVAHRSARTRAHAPRRGRRDGRLSGLLPGPGVAGARRGDAGGTLTRWMPASCGRLALLPPPVSRPAALRTGVVAVAGMPRMVAGRTAIPDFAELAFEIADWILGFQQAEIRRIPQRSSVRHARLYHRAVSRRAGRRRRSRGPAAEEPRHRRYLESCRRGFQFLDGLVIQPRDTSLLPNPAMAIGGLRRSAQRSEVCIDFVQHYLAALIEVCEATQGG